MRGIQINNYINNNISLSGKKINNNYSTQINQPSRPTPLIINHLFNHQSINQFIITERKSSDVKVQNKQLAQSARKKRTNTFINSRVIKQSQSNLQKNKLILSVQKIKKANLSLIMKKVNYDQQINYKKNNNSSFKKLKHAKTKNQQSDIMTVKRSKSTIIKNSNFDNQLIQQNYQQNQKLMKQLKKKKYQTNFRLNIQDKQLDKIKQNKQAKKIKLKNSQNQNIYKSIKVSTKSMKQKKQYDKIQMDLKSFKFQTQKKSARTNSKKSYLFQYKQSQPISARQKTIKKKLFDEIIQFKQINLQNQNHEKIEQKIHQQKQINHRIIINSLKNKRNKQIDNKIKINKNKECMSLKNSRQNSQNKNQVQIHTENNNKNYILQNKNKYPYNNSKETKNVNSTNKNKSRKKKKKRQIKKPISIKTKKNNKQNFIEEKLQGQLKISDQPSPFNYQESDESNHIQSQNQYKNKNNSFQVFSNQSQQQIDDKQNQNSQILNQSNKKYMQFLKILYHSQQTKNNQKNHQKFQDNQNIQNEQNQDEYINFSMNNAIEQKVFNEYQIENQQKQRNHQTFEKINEGKNTIQKQNEQINNGKLNMIQRRIQINKLKQFQKLSDKMMINIQENNNSKKNALLDLKVNQQFKSSINSINKQVLTNDLSLNKIKNNSSPKYVQNYPNFIKSPKFSDIQIGNILAAKQKIFISKHDKMNQLIHKMYEKQLVSPKSYQYTVYQLNRRFQQSNNLIDNFKQHTSKILQQINRNKEDIQDIDGLIREQRWQQAKNYLKQNEKNKIIFKCFLKNNNNIFKQQNFNEYHNQQQLQQGWQKLIINNQYSQISSQKINKRTNSFKFIQNNLNITIQPLNQTNKQLNNIKKELSQKNIKINSKTQIKFEKKQYYQQKFQDIASQLDNQINKKYCLKSLNHQNNIQIVTPCTFHRLSIVNMKQLQSQSFNYCSENLNQIQQSPQQYIYYQSQQSQPIQFLSQNKQTNKFKQQGILKLIQIQNTNNSQIHKQSTFSNIVIQIDDQQYKVQHLLIQHQKSNNTSQIQKQQLKKKDEINSNQFAQNDSNDSLIELELRKGFQSNLFFIKQYCISLCEYMRERQNEKIKFKIKMSSPLQFNLEKLLKKYRLTYQGKYNNQYNSIKQDLQYFKQIRNTQQKAISVQIADQFNKNYSHLKFFNIDLLMYKKSKFNLEKQAEKIFLKAILDVLNQSLDFQRPCSIFGKPLPWFLNQNSLKNLKYLNRDRKNIYNINSNIQQNAQSYDFIFGVAIARIIQWGSCLCGFLPDTAELQNTQIDQAYVIHIRQTRMAFLLEKMLAEQQHNINNSQLQVTQIMLFLGKILMQQLFEQAVIQINTQLIKNKQI